MCIRDRLYVLLLHHKNVYSTGMYNTQSKTARKLYGFSVGIEIDLFVVWVVEIDVISAWQIGVDLISKQG